MYRCWQYLFKILPKMCKFYTVSTIFLNFCILLHCLNVDAIHFHSGNYFLSYSHGFRNHIASWDNNELHSKHGHPSGWLTNIYWQYPLHTQDWLRRRFRFVFGQQIVTIGDRLTSVFGSPFRVSFLCILMQLNKYCDSDWCFHRNCVVLRFAMTYMVARGTGDSGFSSIGSSF